MLSGRRPDGARRLARAAATIAALLFAAGLAAADRLGVF